MATAALLTPRDVPTTLNYYSPIGDEIPYQYVSEPPQGVPQNNIGTDTKPVTIHDARGREPEFSIDTSGFQFVKHSSAEQEFDNEEKIQSVYYKEVEELLKKETGAKRVFIFDHTIRRKPVDTANRSPGNRGPVERVHIDQTYNASVQRVHYHLGDEADRLLKGRVRIINVWRPIHHPVAHKPLAVSDWRYLDTDHDLVPVRHIYPHREGSTFSVRYNPDHKWYYLSNQTPEEVTLIKCYDSSVDRARLTPHSAFADKSSPPEAPQRESIEVRCLVFDTE
ncbi:uncharacterized protein FIBRA_03599 [Fibroporia radiculosa]|uniref:Methyltransferase n=1 Tax=Fibroporia radiculosa TaxID=599839 RepID=J4G609_9APHY|nr:uncharacterized protein FIBRA_03599 [Fibroporia radiculosa]CCM01543.1 predicted protein [Fibroporia radiculosa]